MASFMEKITSAYLIEFIKNTALPFQPSQNRLCLPIINRICRKMSGGLKFDHIKVYENLVLDGHHRYLSAQIQENKLGNVPSNKTSATLEYNWADVLFDENDWDTPEKIQYLNERDALFNEIDLECINLLMQHSE